MITGSRPVRVSRRRFLLGEGADRQGFHVSGSSPGRCRRIAATEPTWVEAAVEIDGLATEAGHGPPKKLTRVRGLRLGEDQNLAAGPSNRSGGGPLLSSSASCSKAWASSELRSAPGEQVTSRRAARARNGAGDRGLMTHFKDLIRDQGPGVSTGLSFP